MTEPASLDTTTLDDAKTTLGPKSSKPWLDLLDIGKTAFADYNLKADNVDKLFANMEKLASSTRQREFQLFWANIQVLGPSIYSRPPVPVVVPRFKDRRPLARTAADLLERTAVVTLEQQDIDSVMIDLRNDLTVVSRGTVWIVLDKDGCSIDHVDRRDFLHDPARTWKEVDWVAKCSWLTKKEARARFKSTSGNAYQNASFTRKKQDEAGYKEGDSRPKAPFWELWSKSGDIVVWVAEGCDKTLDEGKPHLNLEGFFPCPKPVYGTCQRGTLVPIPDVLFYKDQLEEINEITGRIGALTEALRVKGFYPAGAGNVSDAIENAIKNNNNNVMLQPISNWAMMGTGSPKDMVMWWPLDQVSSVIEQLIALRKQLIEDVYQITGLSDIMRGTSVASETLGAQQLKSQYGSVRIRDRQNELVRIARDLTRIVCEIMAENYAPETMLRMSQLEIPSDADVQGQIAQLGQQKAQIQQMAQQAMQNPEVMAKIQENPEMAQQAQQQIQQQIEGLDKQAQELSETVTIEQTMTFLRDHKMRSFTLDIETDSTIQPDEDATKQRATEYITSMSGLIGQAVPMVMEVPQIAPLVSEMINFANKQFRIGREMEQVVEEFTDQMKEMAQQPKPDPAAAEAQIKQQEMQAQQAKEQQAFEGEQAKMAADAESEKVAAMQKAQADQLAAAEKQQANEIKAQADKQAAQFKHEIALAMEASKAETERIKIIEDYKLKQFIAESEQALKRDLAIADVGLKFQKETLSAEQAAQQQAEKQEQESAKAAEGEETKAKAADTDKAAAASLESLGQSVLQMGQSIIAAHKTKRKVTSPEGRVFISEAFS